MTIVQIGVVSVFFVSKYILTEKNLDVYRERLSKRNPENTQRYINCSAIEVIYRGSSSLTSLRHCHMNINEKL